jgi:hypothetical protein
LSLDIEPLSRFVSEFVVGLVVYAKAMFKMFNEVAPVLLVTRGQKIIPNPEEEFQIVRGDSPLVMTPTRDSIEKFRAALASLQRD